MGRAFVCHGGLYRKPQEKPKGVTAAAMVAADDAAERLELSRLGNLEDLRAAPRGGPDPNGTFARLLASDVVWSDPGREVRAHRPWRVLCDSCAHAHPVPCSGGFAVQHNARLRAGVRA